MRPYQAERPDLSTFVGRQAVISDIRTRAAAGSSWYMAAGRRTGKTMLLRKLEKALKELGVLCVYIDGQSVPAGASVAQLMTDLVTATAPEGQARQGGTVRELETAIAEGADSGRRWCLMLDEVETISAMDDAEVFLDNLRYLASNSTVADAVSVGLAGGLDLLTHLRTSGSALSNICTPILLEPLQESDVLDLARLGTTDQVSEAVAHFLFRVAGGHPYLNQFLLERASPPQDPPQVESVFEPFIGDAVERMSPHLRRLDPVLRRAADAVLRGDAAEPRVVRTLTAAGVLASGSGSPRVNGEIVAAALSDHADAAPGPRALADETSVAWLPALIAAGETPVVEFKSSIRWDYRRDARSDDLALEVTQAVAGFMNTSGGALVVGVGPNGDVLGLRRDVDLNRRNPTIDGLYWSVADLLSKRLGAAAATRVDMATVPLGDEVVLVLSVDQSESPVFVGLKDRSAFYVRVGTTTRELDAKECWEYLRGRDQPRS